MRRIKEKLGKHCPNKNQGPIWLEGNSYDKIYGALKWTTIKCSVGFRRKSMVEDWRP